MLLSYKLKSSSVALCVVTPHSDLVDYQNFRGSCCLHLNHPEDAGSIALWHNGILPHHYMVSQPRRQWPESSSLWKPQISHSIKFIMQKWI